MIKNLLFTLVLVQIACTKLPEEFLRQWHTCSKDEIKSDILSLIQLEKTEKQAFQIISIEIAPKYENTRTQILDLVNCMNLSKYESSEKELRFIYQTRYQRGDKSGYDTELDKFKAIHKDKNLPIVQHIYLKREDEIK